jgi:hypothetical protein
LCWACSLGPLSLRFFDMIALRVQSGAGTSPAAPGVDLMALGEQPVDPIIDIPCRAAPRAVRPQVGLLDGGHERLPADGQIAARWRT